MEKTQISVKGDEIDIEGSIDDAISMLQKYKDNGWTVIDTVFAGDYKWHIVGKYRLETDSEYQIRLKAKEKQKQARLKEKEKQKQARREQYEELKKEFGDS